MAFQIWSYWYPYGNKYKTREKQNYLWIQTSKFSQDYKQNIKSPYSKVAFVEKFFVGTILIGDIFYAYCRFIFDPGGIKLI